MTCPQCGGEWKHCRRAINSFDGLLTTPHEYYELTCERGHPLWISSDYLNVTHVVSPTKEKS